MPSKDPYKTLGVSRTARQDEIQTAYRRLAQSYHPDVNGSPGAEERFKEIAAAYEILGDRDKRRKYDLACKNPLLSRCGLWPRDPYRGAAEPDHNSVVPRNRYGGMDRWTDGPEDISDQQPRRRGEDREATLDVSRREAFRGGVRTIELVRVDCGIDGSRQRVREFLEVEVPRGVTAGSLIRVRGHGSPGRGGGADGDLYLKVRIIPDD